jgi:hypothetical protein
MPEDCTSLVPLSADLAAAYWAMSHRVGFHIVLGHGPSGCVSRGLARANGAPLCPRRLLFPRRKQEL